MLSIVDSFSQLPSPVFAVGNVAPDACLLVRAAARASPAAQRSDGQVVVGAPPLQMGEQLWKLLGCGLGPACERCSAMSNLQIHALNKGGVQPT